MSAHDHKSAVRPAPDKVLTSIAGYARDYEIRSELAYDTARYCLMDTLACGLQALKYAACLRVMGPVVPGATMAGGARVPGTSFELDPVQAAFNIGAMGPSVGQPGRDPRDRRLPVAPVAGDRCGRPHGARRARWHDQGA